MNKFLTTGFLLVITVVAGAWLLMRPTETGSTTFTLPGAAQAQEAPAETTDETTADTPTDPAQITIPDMVMGSPDAPVTMIEYASFTCPHCAAFHEDQFQQLKRDYIDTGKVRFILREVYFDRFGLWASMVARCGGEMRYFGIHDVLFATQSDWIAGGQDPALIADNIRKIGIAAGLDAAQVDACMQDADKAQALVAWFQDNAARDEVTSTPTLFIDGTKYSNMAYGELQALIEEQLAAQ